MSSPDPRKYGLYPAYRLDDMTMCVSCAYRNTAVGFALAGQRMPRSMEEGIADLVLTAVLKGEPSKPPVGVPNPTGECDGSCGRDLAEFTVEFQEAA